MDIEQKFTLGGFDAIFDSSIPKVDKKIQEDIIEDDIKEFYYRGLKEWKNEQGYLMDTCLTAQDRFKVYMDYFGLEYRD